MSSKRAYVLATMGAVFTVFAVYAFMTSIDTAPWWMRGIMGGLVWLNGMATVDLAILGRRTRRRERGRLYQRNAGQ